MEVWPQESEIASYLFIYLFTPNFAGPGRLQRLQVWPLRQIPGYAYIDRPN